MFDDEENDFVPRDLFTPGPEAVVESLSFPKKRCRGKALPWQLCPGGVTIPNLEAVIKDALDSNMCKVGSKNDMHRFRCRELNCEFMSEYRLAAFDAHYVVYSCYLHVHAPQSDSEIETGRGLSLPQIALVEEAFGLKITAARPILEYIREKRQRTMNVLEQSVFPLDPERSKMNYLIQKIKNKKGYVNYPTPRLLKAWCDEHGTTSVDFNNEATHNTPFVLRYKLVSFFFFLLFNYEN